jgi:hypothetical protein
MESSSSALLRMSGSQPGWAVAFCGGRHDPDEILHALRRQLSSIPVVGGSAVGVITNDGLGYAGFECAVAVFPACIPRPAFVTVDGLERGTRDAGIELGFRTKENFDNPLWSMMNSLLRSRRSK